MEKGNFCDQSFTFDALLATSATVVLKRPSFGASLRHCNLSPTLKADGATQSSCIE